MHLATAESNQEILTFKAPESTPKFLPVGVLSAYAPSMQSFRTPLAWAAIFLAVTAVTFLSRLSAEEPIADPASKLIRQKLTEDEVKRCRALFRQLSSDDFDIREKAVNDLMNFGAPVLEIAAEFFKDSDPEVASQAMSFSDRLVMQFDGYLPTDAKVAELLKKPVRLDELTEGKTSTEVLRQLAEKAGLRLITEAANVREFPLPRGYFGQNELSVEGAIRLIANQLLGGATVIRGDTLVLTTPEAAGLLRLQRRPIDWSFLELSRDEAERTGAMLRPFFPGETELSTTSEVLLVRGPEESIPRAARLAALLKPGSPDAIFPHSAAAEEVLATLQRRVDLMLGADDPLHAIEFLKKQDVAVYAASPSTSPEGVQERFPRELQGMAPLRLSLKQVPLGLAMRWLARRARIITQEQPDFTVAYALSPGGRVLLRLQAKSRDPFELSLAGSDVSFLYPKDAIPNATTDRDVRKQVLAALESHLALFPKVAAEDVEVIRGRLLMQAPAPTLKTVLNLIGSWRQSGQPPSPAAWKQELNTALDQPLDWTQCDPNGAALTGGRVIPTLRKLGKINILLEDAADGTAAELSIKPSDAKLLAPGKHTLRALLDELSAKTGAQWQIDCGVVTITPRAKGKVAD